MAERGVKVREVHVMCLGNGDTGQDIAGTKKQEDGVNVKLYDSLDVGCVGVWGI